MKVDHAEVLALVFFIAGAVIGIGIDGKYVPDMKVVLPGIITAIATLAAAYYGASFAYRREVEKRKHEENERNRVAGNRALLTLTYQNRLVKEFHKRVFEPYRDDPTKGERMPAPPPHDISNLRVDIDSLSFLLDQHEEGVACLLNLANTQEALRNCFDMIGHWHEMKREISPEAAAVLAESVIKTVDSTISLLSDARKHFGKVLLDIFPTRTTGRAKASTNSA